jgi:hypothetical protein
MPKRRFVEIIEDNDWEGETWSFWIPEEGNEQALKMLEVILQAKDCEHRVGDTLPENELDVLIKHSRSECSYLPRHSKLEGALSLPESDDHEEIRGSLYKGGIRDMVKKAKKTKAAKTKKL